MEVTPWISQLKTVTADIVKREGLRGPAPVEKAFLAYSRPQVADFAAADIPDKTHEHFRMWCYERWNAWMQQQVSQQDAPLYRALYRRLRKEFLPGFAKRVKASGGRQEDAEDAFQDAFVHFMGLVARGDYTYQPTTKMITFFDRVAGNQWRKRRKQLFGRHMEDVAEVALADEDADWLAWEEIITRSRELRKMLGRLGERCQTIIQRFYFQRWGHDDIGPTMNLSPQSSRNQLYRCMKDLRNLYTLPLLREELARMEYNLMHPAAGHHWTDPWRQLWDMLMQYLQHACRLARPSQDDGATLRDRLEAQGMAGRRVTLILYLHQEIQTALTSDDPPQDRALRQCLAVFQSLISHAA